MNHTENRYSVPPDTIAAIVILAFSLFLLTLVENIPAESALFPKAVLRTMVALAIILGIRGFVLNRRADSSKRLTFNRRQFVRIVGIVGMYAVAVEFIGFYSSTIIMLPAAAFLSGYRDIRITILTTITLVAALLIVFTFTMGREFPIEFFLR